MKSVQENEAARLCFESPTLWSLRPKIHDTAGYKQNYGVRWNFVKPGSMKLAMGHLQHDEAAPWNRALQTYVPPWIQGLVYQDQ